VAYLIIYQLDLVVGFKSHIRAISKTIAIGAISIPKKKTFIIIELGSGFLSFFK